MTIHSADIEPAGNRVDYVLVINGLPAARFDDLQKAIAARQLTIEQALNAELLSASQIKKGRRRET
jgi:hypothetical protein